MSLLFCGEWGALHTNCLIAGQHGLWQKHSFWFWFWLQFEINKQVHRHVHRLKNKLWWRMACCRLKCRMFRFFLDIPYNKLQYMETKDLVAYATLCSIIIVFNMQLFSVKNMILKENTGFLVQHAVENVQTDTSMRSWQWKVQKSRPY